MSIHSRIRGSARGIALSGLILLTYVAVAGAQQTPPEQRHQWFQNHLEMKDRSPFKNLTWQLLGPMNISGRMTDVAVVQPKGENYTIYVAGASGGVWKTTNEGISWEPVFEHEISTSIGDVTLAPSNPDIVWVGTGEANIFRSSMAGGGVYKSTDAGESWHFMGLGGTNTIPRIVIHPTNPDIVYVAASGNEWTKSEDRGLYKSTNGGRSWDKILYVDEMTAVIDLVMHPTDPNTLYAATWQRVREKWNDPRNEPDYDGSGIHKTTDGGATWTEINDGLPAPQHRGRIGIDIARSSPETVYAFIDNYETAREAPEGTTDAYGRPRGPTIKGASVWRSDNGGPWRMASEESPYMEGASGTYGWVFGQMRVDPNDAEKVYIMGLSLNVSEDGGRTFRTLPGMHVDHHGLWIDPDNSDYLVNVNDGGVAISYDGGDNWRTFYQNLPLVQFFNVGHDMGDPFHVLGSVQDHGSYRGVVDLSRGRHAIPAVEWESTPGGEGSSHAVDPTDENIVYSAGFYGTISRTNLATGENVMLVPRAPQGEPAYRGQWVAPFIISPHNPRIIYHGMNYLFRSMDRGENFEAISPDLTRNYQDELGDIPFQTIFSIAESPFKFGLIYVGTDDGRIHRTDNGGESWVEINRGVPEKWIAELVASKYDEATVYMAQNGKRDDDFTPYLWKSTDYGRSWTSIVNNLPSGPVNVIKEDPKHENILYAGTDIGAYVSLNGGQEWHVLAGGGFPSTFVADMIIHPREDILVAATHGRGMYAMDIRFIQQMTPSVMGEALHLFDIAPVQVARGGRFGGGRTTAYLSYNLGSDGNVSIIIKDSDGDVVREWVGTGDAGFNAVEWDLTREGGAQEGRFRRAPTVQPGEYTVEVQAGSATAEGTLVITG